VLLTLDCLLDMLTEDGVLEVVAFLTEIHTNDMEVAITVAGLPDLLFCCQFHYSVADVGRDLQTSYVRL